MKTNLQKLYPELQPDLKVFEDLKEKEPTKLEILKGLFIMFFFTLATIYIAYRIVVG